jgi:hypothetical protein
MQAEHAEERGEVAAEADGSGRAGPDRREHDQCSYESSFAHAPASRDPTAASALQYSGLDCVEFDRASLIPVASQPVGQVA